VSTATALLARACLGTANTITLQICWSTTRKSLSVKSRFRTVHNVDIKMPVGLSYTEKKRIPTTTPNECYAWSYHPKSRASHNNTHSPRRSPSFRGCSDGAEFRVSLIAGWDGIDPIILDSNVPKTISRKTASQSTTIQDSSLNPQTSVPNN
jgi:hypothetical protein